MEFERLFLTPKYEFYRFSLNYDDVAYLLITDNFNPAPPEFGTPFFDNTFEPNENQISVQCGVLRKLSENEDNYLQSFIEGLLGFKPSIDYSIDYFKIKRELEFDYPTEKGFKELLAQINTLFSSNVIINDFSSFNNIIQK
ncbi:hypothetical protein [Listeria innocua]|uniref:hypothetical protein n=1 Tax=Listeria innocua TaxID=1642 RepID=UPI00162ADF0A|nr:hypothetical protein [Listeria innocua]MBC1339623.1 hypothetical protein [Listeria innocua]